MGHETFYVTIGFFQSTLGDTDFERFKKQYLEHLQGITSSMCEANAKIISMRPAELEAGFELPLRRSVHDSKIRS